VSTNTRPFRLVQTHRPHAPFRLPSANFIFKVPQLIGGAAAAWSHKSNYPSSIPSLCCGFFAAIAAMGIFRIQAYQPMMFMVRTAPSPWGNLNRCRNGATIILGLSENPRLKGPAQPISCLLVYRTTATWITTDLLATQTRNPSSKGSRSRQFLVSGESPTPASRSPSLPTPIVIATEK
jgi:hypothetical protein